MNEWHTALREAVSFSLLSSDVEYSCHLHFISITLRSQRITIRLCVSEQVNKIDK